MTAGVSRFSPDIPKDQCDLWIGSCILYLLLDFYYVGGKPTSRFNFEFEMARECNNTEWMRLS